MFSFDPPENIRKPLVVRRQNNKTTFVQGDEKGTLGRKGLRHFAGQPFHEINSRNVTWSKSTI